MGGNIDKLIDRIIRIDPALYADLPLQQRYAVAAAVGARVAECEDCQILLIGPGRWGTASPELGVPVQFSAIAGVAVLAEVAEAAGAMVPDLSYGSHFFHNLVEDGMSYAAFFPEQEECLYRPERLSQFSDAVSAGTPGTAEAAVQVYTLTTKHLRVVSDTSSREMVGYFTVSR
jgi:hypothetical protein